jgi:hypothetical protein
MASSEQDAAPSTTRAWLHQRRRRLNVHSAVLSTAQREAWEHLRDAELRDAALRASSAAAAHDGAGDDVLPSRHGAGGDVLSLDFNIFEAAECVQRSLMRREAEEEEAAAEPEPEEEEEEEEEGAAFPRVDRLSCAALAGAQHVALRALCAASAEPAAAPARLPAPPPASPAVLRAFVAEASEAYLRAQHTRTAETPPLLRQPAAGYPRGAAADDAVPPYHNFLHVCDVTQAAAALLHGVDPAGAALRPSARLALLVAALLHDLGHGGFTLRFLALRADALLAEHATLEELHAALAEALLRGTDAGRALVASAAAAMAREESGGARGGGAMARAEAWIATVRDCILDTDMGRHPALLARLRAAAAAGGAGVGAGGGGGGGGGGAESNPALVAAVVVQQAAPAASGSAAASVAVQLTLSSMLKAADISNVARSAAVGRAWAERLSEEFRREGDAQKALAQRQQQEPGQEQEQEQCGAPPPMCDRAALASGAAALSSGFIRFVAAPFFDAIAVAVPRLLHAERAEQADCGGREGDDPVAAEMLGKMAAAVAANGTRWLIEARAVATAAAAVEEQEQEKLQRPQPAPLATSGGARAAAIFGARAAQPRPLLAVAPSPAAVAPALARRHRAVRRRSCPETALQALRLQETRAEEPVIVPPQPQPQPQPPQQLGYRPLARATRRRSCPSSISIGLPQRCGSSSSSPSQVSTPSPGMSPVMMMRAC